MRVRVEKVDVLGWTKYCVFCATSDPSLLQDDAFAFKLFTKKVYHEVYERFVKQEAGNYTVESASDGAVLVGRQKVSPQLFRCIKPGE